MTEQEVWQEASKIRKNWKKINIHGIAIFQSGDYYLRVYYTQISRHPTKAGLGQTQILLSTKTEVDKFLRGVK